MKSTRKTLNMRSTPHPPLTNTVWKTLSSETKRLYIAPDQLHISVLLKKVHNVPSSIIYYKKMSN